MSYDASVATTVAEFVAGQENDISGSDLPPADTRLVVNHVPQPKPVKAIYMTSCVAGTVAFRTDLIKLIADTDINSVVIDIKDYTGTISFQPEHPAWLSAWDNARCGTRDVRGLVAELRTAGVYVIGRLTVFQDPFYAGQHPELAVKKSDGVTVKASRLLV